MKMRKVDPLRLLAKKGSIFTFEDAKGITGLSADSLKKLIFRLERKGAIERLEKAKYMIIPLGAEKERYSLHEFVIGSLLVKPYSISYWSALNYYGLTEQIPNTVFIQTTSRKKRQNIDIFGVNYRIVRIKEAKMFGIRRKWIEEVPINITDREKTVIDCLDKPQLCGGILEVAKALESSDLREDRLVEYAERIGNSGVIRRLGYLTELLGMNLKLPRVDTRNYLLLDPTMPKNGKRNAKWRLIINISSSELGLDG